jgi:eukaryotic-like serine/threonine-protein kinase
MTPEEWQRVRPILESALELDPASRASFLDGVCADSFVRREVDSLIACHELAGTDVLNPVSSLGLNTDEETRFRLPPGKRIGAYEILEEIAVGGMGAVYRAIRADGQYEQQVALKIVRPELGAEFTSSRFKNERQILASLNHANIAKILDAGTTADGMPYFVMELVEGQRLDEYCDSHKLATTERLNLFLQICSAVQYAHQRLIIHRDIKPGNILVNAEAVPKLLDFGIAKILESSEVSDKPQQTLSLVRLLTPEYASPEQVRGEPITTASDVYSLGVVLYELLTGRTPYTVPTHTPHELSRAVCEAEPEKPSTAVRRKKIVAVAGEGKQREDLDRSVLREGSPEKLSKRLSGDLDNILLMALRKEPQRRYASVEQFAQDIRRHLEHLPVIARQSTFGYRASKFITRHKAGVAVAALVTVALLSATGVTLRQARIARAERARAERRFNDVRALANALIFDIHDSIQDLPGSTAARKIIVEKALQYLDKLDLESHDDPALQKELAEAYERIGNVQGYIYTANLGDSAGALKSFQKALAIRQGLFESRAAEPTDKLILAKSYRIVAQMLHVSGQTDAALDQCQRAVEAGEQAEQANPNDPNALKEVIQDYQSKATILGSDLNLSSLGNNAEAIVFRGKQLDVAKRLAALFPQDSVAQRGLGIGQTMMGDQLLLSGARAAVLPYYDRAREILEDGARHANGSRPLVVLDTFYEHLALLELGNNDIKSARVTIDKALEISKKLFREDPRDAQTLDGVANDYALGSEVLSRQGKREEAMATAEEAITWAKRLMLLNPHDTEFLGTGVTVYVAAGNVCRRAKDLPCALGRYRQAVLILSEAFAGNSRDAEARVDLASSYNEIAEILLERGDKKEASEYFQKALVLTDLATATKFAHQSEIYTIADSYAGLGLAEEAQARTCTTAGEQIAHWQKAKTWFDQSLGIWNQIKEPCVLRPDGFEVIPSREVQRELSVSMKALKQLQVAN